jgi:hypothetical protein
MRNWTIELKMIRLSRLDVVYSINSVGFASFSPVTDLFNIVIYLALVVNKLFV